MRIAFFVLNFPLVSETFVLNLARAVIDAGHDLDIFSIRNAVQSTQVKHPIIKEYSLLECHAEPHVPKNALARYFAAPAALYRALNSHGLRAMRTIPPFAWHRRAFNLRTLFESAMISDGAYDILHCQFATIAPHILDLKAAGTLSGRLVVHLRGSDISKEIHRPSQHDFKRVFAEADAFIANSRYFSNVAITAGCPAERIQVIPSGLDLGAFPFHPSSPPRSGPLRIVSVGRLVEKKGVRYAIDVLANLRSSGRDVVFDVVGDGILRDQLMKQASELGVSEYVRFHGALSSDAVGRILRGGHLFVAPSVTAASGDQDAATNSVKEAMATGLPVVVTRHGGMPEMVSDGVTGFLVPERDTTRLMTALCRLIDNPWLWMPITKAARTRIETEVSTDVVDPQVLKLYRALSGEPTDLGSTPHSLRGEDS